MSVLLLFYKKNVIYIYFIICVMTWLLFRWNFKVWDLCDDCFFRICAWVFVLFYLSCQFLLTLLPMNGVFVLVFCLKFLILFHIIYIGGGEKSFTINIWFFLCFVCVFKISSWLCGMWIDGRVYAKS